MTNPVDVWKAPWRNPFRGISRMESAIDKIFENFPEVSRRAGENDFNFEPCCEVSEEANQYTLKFDLPGIPKEHVQIELVENQLTLTAERKEEKRKETKRMHLEEINYGSYTRTFTLPSAVDEKKIDAKYENGVLTITIPKVESTKAKQIAIH